MVILFPMMCTGIKVRERKARGLIFLVLFGCLVVFFFFFSKTSIVYGSRAAETRGRVSAAPSPMAGGIKIIEMHLKKKKPARSQSVTKFRNSSPSSPSLVSFEQLAAYPRQNPQNPAFFPKPCPTSLNLLTPSSPASCPKFLEESMSSSWRPVIRAPRDGRDSGEAPPLSPTGCACLGRAG